MQVDRAKKDYNYLPADIYNVDEVGFHVAIRRKSRIVARRGAVKTRKPDPSGGEHISVVSTISTTDAPVPPLILFAAKSLVDDWFKLVKETPKILASYTDSSWTNDFVHMKWLTDCFDPYTRQRAAGRRRLLFLDGLEGHVV